MWRFKTLEEFEEEGLIPYISGNPKCFNSDGQMNYLLGTEIPKEFHINCERGNSFNIINKNQNTRHNSWHIQHFHYTNKPLIGKEPEYEIY